MIKSDLSLEAKIEAIAAGIKVIMKTDHDCQDPKNCDFGLAMFDQIAGKVFPSNSLDEIGKASECMDWCKNAQKLING